MEEGKAEIGGFIRDPLYGYVELTGKKIDIIDNPTFQRLRRIGQLSFVDSTYPSGTHTRFSHSLGVMKLAQMFHVIYGLEITPELKECLELAGLLHDIGHFPFSHAFEPAFFEFVERKENRELTSWKDAHVRMGVRILKNSKHGFINILGLDKINTICSLIDPERESENLPKIYNAILTGDFSIDRLDYLKRDAHHCGTPEYGIVDQKRIISSFIYYEKDPDLSVHDTKALYALENLILSYFFMYRAVYYHKTVRATSLLFQSILWDAFENGVFDNVDWDEPDFWNEFDDCKCLSMLRENKAFFRDKLEMLLKRKILKMIDERDFEEGNKERIVKVCKSYREKVSKEQEIFENLKEKWSSLRIILFDSPYLAPYTPPEETGGGPRVLDKKEESPSLEKLHTKAPYIQSLTKAYYGKARVYCNREAWGKNGSDKKAFINGLNNAIRDKIRL